MNYFKRSFILFALVVLPLFYFTGCSKDEESKPTLIITSRLWDKPTEQEFVLRNILDPFAEEHNINVELRTGNDFDSINKMQVQKAADNISFDLVIADSSFMKLWIDKGYVQDITDEANKWDDRTPLSILKTNTEVDGKTYFIPVTADVRLLLINKKALPFLPEGYDIDNLTWEQYVNWSNTIREETGRGQTVIAGASQGSFLYSFAICALSYGASFPDVNSEGALQAWKIYEKLAPDFVPNTRNINDSTVSMKREEGWLSDMNSARLGQVYAANKTKYEVAPVPKGSDGRGIVVGSTGIGLIAGSKNEEMAMKLMNYLTEPKILIELAKGTGGFIPPMEEAVKYLGDEPGDVVIQKSLEELKDGIIGFYCPGDYKDWNSVKGVFESIFQNEILEGKSVTPEILSKAAKELEELKK